MKRKLLLVTDVMGLGGVEKVIVDTLNGINYSKFEVTLFVMYKTEDEKHNIKSIPNNVRIKYLFENPISGTYQRILFLLFMFFPPTIINKFIVKEQYDIIVTTKDMFSYPISVNKCTKVMWNHGGLEYLESENSSLIKSFKKLYKRRAYRKFNKFLFLTNSAKKIFCEKYKIEEGLCKVHINPINNKKILSLCNEDVMDYNFGSDIVLVCSCRLSIEKGIDRLLRVCEKLLEEGYNFNLLILGDGAEKANLKEHVLRSPLLTQRVTFLGFKENPYKYLKKSTIYVSPSTTEGFSLSIAEAIMLELPILSTNCHGPSEILGNGEYGLLVQNKDDNIYQGLRKLFTEPELIEFYKSKSKERKDFFSYKKNIRIFEEIISS